MPTYSTRVEFSDPEHKQALIRVQTDRCLYRVNTAGDEIQVMGPGVNETYSIEEDLFPCEGSEALALLAIILFEQGA